MLVRNVGMTIAVWLNRLMTQPHPGLLGSPAGLAAITGYTGTHYIFPGVLAAPVAWYDVVQGKLPGFLATVLAGIMVTFEDLESGQFLLRLRRAPDEGSQPDD